jgi:hypothetical protein
VVVSWAHLAATEPDLADHVRRCFAVRKHSTVATLRRDGSPRISGTEVEFASDGELYLGMMPGSVKALDLQRDPRLALHSPTEDPPEDNPSSWLGDAKIAGQAVEVSTRTQPGDPHRFRIDIDEAVVTAVDRDELVIRSWHPDRGLQARRRR